MSADEYVPRECECSHREHSHTPGCRGEQFIYVLYAKTPRPEWKPMPTHQRAADAGLQMYAAPCPCERFYEYEGEQP